VLWVSTTSRSTAPRSCCCNCTQTVAFQSHTLDTWRLGGADEFLAIGSEEYLHSPHWLCLIEWACRVSECLPEDHLQITIQHTGPESRHFRLSATGPRAEQVLTALTVAVDRASTTHLEH
jgi:tRNA A37 threonylcarbamoyladenosine biosynthesis protein TsaE